MPKRHGKTLLISDYSLKARKKNKPHYLTKKHGKLQKNKDSRKMGKA